MVGSCSGRSAEARIRADAIDHSAFSRLSCKVPEPSLLEHENSTAVVDDKYLTCARLKSGFLNFCIIARLLILPVYNMEEATTPEQPKRAKKLGRIAVYIFAAIGLLLTLMIAYFALSAKGQPAARTFDANEAIDSVMTRNYGKYSKAMSSTWSPVAVPPMATIRSMACSSCATAKGNFTNTAIRAAQAVSIRSLRNACTSKP
jgi:hypothetical protein